MKTSIATSISIVGVLAAGAAAFAVNTAVLDFSPSTATEAVAEVVATDSVQDTAVAEQSIAGSTSNTQPSPQAPVPVPQAVVAALPTVSQTSTYRVGDSGRVILEVRENSLRVANVLPAANWSASRPEYEDGEVEVSFYSGSVEVEFKARLVNGDIKVFVETENEAAADSYEREYHDDDDHDDDHDHEDEKDDD